MVIAFHGVADPVATAQRHRGVDRRPSRRLDPLLTMRRASDPDLADVDPGNVWRAGAGQIERWGRGQGVQ